MDFMQLAKERYTVRQYTSAPVEEGKLQRVLEAGRVAPTAGNFQSQRFLVITAREGLSKLGKAANIHGAPVAVVVCSHDEKSWKRPQDGHPMGEIDATIATTHMMLQAWSDGLGSCWITWFDPAIVRSEFSLPDNITPVNIFVFGYGTGPSQTPCRHQQQRNPIEDMVWREALPCQIK